MASCAAGNHIHSLQVRQHTGGGHNMNDTYMYNAKQQPSQTMTCICSGLKFISQENITSQSFTKVADLFICIHSPPLHCITRSAYMQGRVRAWHCVILRGCDSESTDMFIHGPILTGMLPIKQTDNRWLQPQYICKCTKNCKSQSLVSFNLLVSSSTVLKYNF